MKINLTYMTFNKRNSIFISIVTYNGVTSVYIRKVLFINITQPKGESAIYIMLINQGKRIYTQANKIVFTLCRFININGLSHLILLRSNQRGYIYSEISISKSSFHHISYAIILATKTSIKSVQKPKILVYFKYVKLNLVNHAKHVMYLEDTSLQLQDQVFTNINCNDSVIETKNSQILFNQYIEFSMIDTKWCIVIDYVRIDENTLVNFTTNRVLGMFTLPNQKRLFTLYEQTMQNYFPCFFQFVSRRGNLDERFYQGVQFNYSILFTHNIGTKLSSIKYALQHCTWVYESAFTLTNSKEVNHQFIHLNNNNFSQRTDIKKTSVCKNNYIDYTNDIIGPIYPGQTLKLTIYVKTTVVFQINDLSNMACKIYSSNISNSMQAAKHPRTHVVPLHLMYDTKMTKAVNYTYKGS